MKNTISKTALGLIVGALANNASALDIEIDPTAYLFGGHSVHFGFGGDNFRFDIGTFGMELPDSFNNDENYDLEFDGFGVKLDYLFGRYDGWFVGVEANSSDVTYTRKSTNETATRTQVSLGPRFGYRIMYTENITITPWLGINLNLEYDDVILDGERYERESVTFFPAVHIGWKL